jgi:hypothetical protein
MVQGILTRGLNAQQVIKSLLPGSAAPLASSHLLLPLLLSLRLETDPRCILI